MSGRYRASSDTPYLTRSSRLERIIKLLDSASSPSFRSLAAKQIGEIVQSQPSLARSIIAQVQTGSIVGFPLILSFFLVGTASLQ